MNATRETRIRAALRPSEALQARFGALAMQVREWAAAFSAPVSIGITGVKSGVGTSTVAYNLAHALSSGLAPEKVLLIEGSFGTPFVFKELTTGLAEVLQGQADFDDCVLRTLPEQPCLLACGKTTLRGASELPWGRLDTVLQVQASRFEFVIFDLPPIAPDGLCQEISSQLTGLLVVNEPNDLGNEQLERMRRQLQKTPVEFLGRVVNKSLGN